MQSDKATSEKFSNVVETTQLPPFPAASTPSLQRAQTSFFSPPSHSKCEAGAGAGAGWTPGPAAGECQVSGLLAATPSAAVARSTRWPATHDHLLSDLEVSCPMITQLYLDTQLYSRTAVQP